MKSITIILTALSLFLVPLAGADEKVTYDRDDAELHFDWKGIEKSDSAFSVKSAEKLHERLEEELRQDSNLLAKALRDGAVISALKTSNEEHKNSSEQDFQNTDEAWKSIKGFDVAKKIIDPTCSKVLREFQGKERDFAEIFITNKKGLNVCQTNMTSDAYQADEEWWSYAMSQGAGKASHGNLEYDESALTYAIPVYVPVVDTASGEVIGIAKGVIRRELEGESREATG